MKRLLFLAVFSITTYFLNAQTSDLGMWNTVSVGKDITKKFNVGIDQELRLRENLSTINLVYTNFGVSYKFADFFKQFVARQIFGDKRPVVIMVGGRFEKLFARAAVGIDRKALNSRQRNRVFHIFRDI